MLIYKITFPNNKVYIGQTIQPLERRFYSHKNDAIHKRDITEFSYGSRIGHAIRKYGLELEQFEVIDRGNSLEDLNNKETYWIEHYNSTNSDFGYNLNSGGGNNLHSEETKKKIGNATKERWQNEEIADRMRQGLKAGVEAMKETKGILRVERIEIECQLCGKKFEAREKENRKFCSRKCSAKNGFTIASEKVHEEYLERHLTTKDLVHQWALENKELIEKCPFNKISTNLSTLLKITKIGDWRTLTQAVIKSQSRKEFLNYLKNYVKMYAEPTDD